MANGIATWDTGQNDQLTIGDCSDPSHILPSNGHYHANGSLTPDVSCSDRHINPCHDPIAICGLGIRLPGGIRNAEEFWDLLVNGEDARGPIPSDRYQSQSFSSAMGKKGVIDLQSGYFLEDDLGHLDASFFSMSKDELEKMDPQQRLLLEVTYECLESAGEIHYRGKLIGCYVGTFGEDWLEMSARENQHSGNYVLTGHSDFILSNRISYEYDLRGPRCVIDINTFLVVPT